MTLKAEQGNWDSDFTNKTTTPGGDRNRVPYMKFPTSKTYRVRLIGGHVKYLKYWKPINAITHSEYGDKDPLIKAGFRPMTRFAIHVIDREDGELKILDKGNEIFKHFANYKTEFDINPAGKEAPDFLITVKQTMKNGKVDPQSVEYSVMPDRKDSILTKEEIEMYQTKKAPLADIYKSSPIEDIVAQWEKLSDEEKVPPKKEYKNKFGDKSKTESSKTESSKTESPKTTVSSNELDDASKKPAKQEIKVPETKKEEKNDLAKDDEDLFGSGDGESTDDSSALF